MSPPTKIKVSQLKLSKMIDHSLLHPTMTDQETREGLEVARAFNCATACVKPYAIPLALELLQGSDVAVCAVVGFPHGNSATEVKVYEAAQASRAGATEIDVVVNVGKVLSGDWEYVAREIKAVNDAVVGLGGILKVIFENDFLQNEQIEKLCRICSDVGVAFVKTSTGYGYVKQDNGMFSTDGATKPHLLLMKQSIGAGVQVKAAGGVRTLDQLLCVMALGVTRIGATATVKILEEAKARGILDEEVEVEVDLAAMDKAGPGY